MIIKTQADVTPAVLAEIARADDPRFREIMSALVRHMHAFVREVRLTEEEYRDAIGKVARMGQMTTPSHNEVVLVSANFGLSALICLLNNGDNGLTETTANMLGPFWRLGAPRVPNGGSLLRSPTPGPALFVDARFVDRAGRPVAGAEVDVWHSSTEGFYENQDPGQADMNLRGKLTTDADGRIAFRTVKPVGYPIPIDGPVGDLVRAMKRHNMRPAHLHFVALKEGFKTLISQLYAHDDPHLDSDVQYGVTERLIGTFVRHDSGRPPAADVTAPWYTLAYSFVLEPGAALVPAAPITGRASGDRPVLARLERA